jgi:isocitrate dehydrogenase (NAD+)
MLLSGLMMLKHIGETQAAKNLENAIKIVLREGKALTADLAPTNGVGTAAFADAIIETMQRRAAASASGQLATDVV